MVTGSLPSAFSEKIEKPVERVDNYLPWRYTCLMSISTTVQRNFHLSVEQAEWLRRQAFLTNRPQAEIVREAIAAYQVSVEVPDDPNAAGGADRALMERFREGRGVDLDVLRDQAGEMWSHEDGT